MSIVASNHQTVEDLIKALGLQDQKYLRKVTIEIDYSKGVDVISVKTEKMITEEQIVNVTKVLK